MFTIENAISPEKSFEIERAISYLVNQYNDSGHNKKPVILHSLRIATMLLEMSYREQIIIGGILHDILEDTNVTAAQIESDFGEEMLSLIKAVSYDKSIVDLTAQYKDMYERIVAYGEGAIVLKAVDIAVNSLYIHLVPDVEQRRALVEKGTYFLNLTKNYLTEPAWQLLEKRNLEEISKLS